MDNSNEQIDPNLIRQVKVSKLLSLGFVCSLVWLGGIGSLIAFICGVRALNLIKEIDGEISGKGMAWWCIVFGSVGMIVLPYLIISRW